MSADNPIPLDSLTPEHRAILSLLLVQGRSYSEISELLKIDSERVRERAHAAIEALSAAELPRPGAADRARIADYLVGEQSVSERARTRAQLAGSQCERAWAAAIAVGLTPLARAPLPAIPDLGSNSPADRGAAPPTQPDVPRPASIPPAAGGGSGPRTLPHRTLIAFLGLLGAATVAVILVVVISDGSNSKVMGNSTSPGQGVRSARTIKRLVLVPASTNRKAVGAAAIVRQARGGMLLLLQGRGLAANHGDSYAVWLFNTPGDSRLLGFISPDVGAAGTFSSGTPLPDDAVRFRELIVTLESTSRPGVPGQAVLKSRLALS